MESIQGLWRKQEAFSLTDYNYLLLKNLLIRDLILYSLFKILYLHNKLKLILQLNSDNSYVKYSLLGQIIVLILIPKQKLIP